MKKFIKFIKEIYHRFRLPSPAIFKKVQEICLTLAALIGGLSGYILNSNPNSRLGIALASFTATLGVIGGFIARLPVDKIEELYKIIKPEETLQNADVNSNISNS